ncbi:MAG: hypothetical protein KKD86_06360 [Bacteroidetes bacterium]|nr:hypothetical protein [Bacteroidota bacterium]
MRPIICFYCEANEIKAAVFSKDKTGIKIHRTLSVRLEGLGKAGANGTLDIHNLDMGDLSGGNLSLDGMSEPHISSESAQDTSDVGKIAGLLSDIKLTNVDFIPVLTDPIVSFHVYEGEAAKDKNKLLDRISDDIYNVKGIYINRDHIDCVKLNGKAHLCVFIENEIPCVNLLNSLATYHGRSRPYSIKTIKCAEIALANYVSQNLKFFPEDYSLIIYTGKDTSELIFLEGQSLKHIGSTLDIGTSNIHTYDVYFSKILLEMENGGIPRLDNVVLCGDDKSENMVLSFYGTFPEANVIPLTFDLFDMTELSKDDKENISSFAVPLSAAYEYFHEKEKEFNGINILPAYISESRKVLQFGWHSYLMLIVLFIATLFFTIKFLSNIKTSADLDKEIVRLVELESRNQEIVDKITPLTTRISNFDNTQSILDSASVGTEIWGTTLESTSNFIERRRNFWISSLDGLSEEELIIKGYSLSRTAVTEFAEFSNSSILKNVLYESLREKNAFTYVLNTKIDRNLPK